VSNENHTALSIYGLARSTYPVYEVEDAADGEDEDSAIVDFPNSTIKTKVNTIIGCGLRIFSHLPPEIRSMISARFVRNLSYSLLTVGETSSAGRVQMLSSSNVTPWSRHFTPSRF
jgi:hypothetical protein